MDVYLDQPPNEVPPGSDASTPPQRIYKGSFTARQVESQSWRFLSTFPFDAAREMGARYGGRAVVLENVYCNFNDRPPPGVLVPPAVSWRGPWSVGQDLVLLGCLFRGPRPRVAAMGMTPEFPEQPAPSGMVVVGQLRKTSAFNRGKVYALGVRSQSDQGEVFYDGVNGARVLETMPPAWLLQLPRTGM